MRNRSTRPNRAYAAIPNAAMRDEGLSLEARGLLALMMTYSDDWTFYVPQLQKTAKVGRDVMRRLLKELEQAGYVVREVGRGENNRLSGSEWVINDDPDSTTSGVLETEGKPDTGKPARTKRVSRPPEIQAIGKNEQKTPENAGDSSGSVGEACNSADSLNSRRSETPTVGNSGHLRRTTLKKTNNKNPQPPNADPPTAKQSLDDAAKMWVEAVKAGKGYAASSISMPVARRMLELKLVTSEELKKLGVAY